VTVDIAELERLKNAATALPYTTTPDDGSPAHLLCTATGAWFGDINVSTHNAETADYIAAACNAVPELIERLRVAEGIVSDLASMKEPIGVDVDMGARRYYCTMCNAQQRDETGGSHAASCLYRRAVEAKR
jgi:hypothetical protein